MSDKRSGLLHVEAPGCIVNVYTGLSDADGRKVTRVEVIADGDRYAGEPPWFIEGDPARSSVGIRIIEQTEKKPG